MVFLFEGIQACANANASDSQVRPLSELTVRIYIIEQYVIKLVWYNCRLSSLENNAPEMRPSTRVGMSHFFHSEMNDGAER